MCACFLVECTRANSITRSENGEESFETLGFEKNFVHTINNLTQRWNTSDKKGDQKSRGDSFTKTDYFDKKERGGNITFKCEKLYDISRTTTASMIS